MALSPHMRIPVGVIVERRKSSSPWVDFIWRPTAVLVGLPDAAPWTRLAEDGDRVQFYAGTAEIELYRSETENYRNNLASGAPSVWIVLQGTVGDPPYEIAAATVDPAEGEALTEPAQAIVETVAMPQSLCDTVAAFVDAYHVERAFEKRNRDRADLETLARRAPASRGDHD